MKDDTLSLLLQAEKEYHSAVKEAVRDAEKYADNRRAEQVVYLEEQKQTWRLFESAEGEKLEQALLVESEKLEEEAVKLKEQMKLRQTEKADWISERLKERVMSLLWQ